MYRMDALSFTFTNFGVFVMLAIVCELALGEVFDINFNGYAGSVRA